MATFQEVIWRFEEDVRTILKTREDLTYRQIGQLFGISESRVIVIAKKFRLRRAWGRKKHAQRVS